MQPVGASARSARVKVPTIKQRDAQRFGSSRRRLSQTPQELHLPRQPSAGWPSMVYAARPYEPAPGDKIADADGDNARLAEQPVDNFAIEIVSRDMGLVLIQRQLKTSHQNVVRLETGIHI